MEKLAMVKHSSLLGALNYVRKRFYNIGTRIPIGAVTRWTKDSEPSRLQFWSETLISGNKPIQNFRPRSLRAWSKGLGLGLGPRAWD
jgi:hypothetical protein